MSHFCWYLFFSTTILRKNFRLLRASDLDCRNRMLTTWPPPRPNKDDFWIVLFAIVTYDKNLPWSDCGSVPCWSCWQAPGLVSRSNTGASSGLFSVRQEQQHGTSRLQRMIFMKGWKTSLVVKPRFRKTDVVFYFKNVYSFKDVCFWNKDVCLFRPASSFKWFQFLAFSALKKIFDGRLMRSKLATERNDSHS